MRRVSQHDLLQDAVMDAAAAHCARGGDASAFESLVRKYHARVYQFVLRRGIGRSDAEDLTQETFLRAWRAIGAFDPGGRARFSTWLFTIASRLASTHRRDAKNAARASQRLAQRAAREPHHRGREPGEGLSPGALPVGADLWALADRVLGDEARSAMWLRYAEDLTPEEIGLVLERSGVSVRVMLFRGRARLAKELERQGAGGRRPDPVRLMQENCHA